MSIKSITSRDLNQDTNRAKKAANDGPVVITDRGRPAYVLMTFDAYQLLAGHKPMIADRNIIELLSMPDGHEIDFDIPKLDLTLRSPDFS